jgi:hypothetical protein
METTSYHKRYYIKNKNDIDEYQKAYYEANKAKVLEEKREFYQKNRDKIIERSLKRYYANKDKILEKRPCELCGCEITKTQLSRHQQTKKCINNRKKED